MFDEIKKNISAEEKKKKIKNAEILKSIIRTKSELNTNIKNYEYA